MQTLSLLCALLFGAHVSHVPAKKSDLTIKLVDRKPVSRTHSRYRCDANGAKLGLPQGVFAVEYINRGDNHLAIVPVHGTSLIFANVVSGSGARYASGSLIWWTGRAITLSSEGLGEKMISACEEIK
jgi:membrane-bound inhibitor of C-type lysozyme